MFIGLEDHQAPPLLRQIRNGPRAKWGQPTPAPRDPDGNELFLWIPDSEWAILPPDRPASAAGNQNPPRTRTGLDPFSHCSTGEVEDGYCPARAVRRKQ